MSAEAHSRGEDPRARAARHRGRAADLRKQAEIEEAWAAELDGEVRATSTTSAPDRERAPVDVPGNDVSPPQPPPPAEQLGAGEIEILGLCGAFHDRRLPRSLDGLLRHGSLLVQHRLRSEEASGVRTGCADAPRPLPPPRRGSRPDVRGRERGRPGPVMGARATIDERGLRDHLGAVLRRALRPSTVGGQLDTWGAERRASAADPAAAVQRPHARFDAEARAVLPTVTPSPATPSEAAPPQLTVAEAAMPMPVVLAEPARVPHFRRLHHRR